MSKKIFNKETKYLSSTIVKTDGKVIIEPEEDVDCMPGTRKLSKTQKGELTTYYDGEMIFEPEERRESGARRYTTLRSTKHGEVKEYAKSLIISFKFDRFSNRQQIIGELVDETIQMLDTIANYKPEEE